MEVKPDSNVEQRDAIGIGTPTPETMYFLFQKGARIHPFLPQQVGKTIRILLFTVLMSFTELPCYRLREYGSRAASHDFLASI